MSNQKLRTFVDRYLSGDQSSEVLQGIKDYYLNRSHVWVEALDHPSVFRRFKWIYLCLKHKSIDSSILDIGSWTGCIADGLCQSGFRDITCLDICPKVCEVGSTTFPHLNFVQGDIEEWESDKKFDIILACEVLEHIFDPMAALTKIRSWLTKGGLALVTVPILEKLSSDINPEHITIVTNEQLGKFGKVVRISSRTEEWYACSIRG